MSGKKKKLIVIVFILIINSLAFIPRVKEYFWGGSNYVFVDFLVLNVVYSSTITIGLIFLILLFDKQKKYLLPIVLVLFFAWILSGRIIGVSIDKNNFEVVSGWFYVATNFSKTKINFSNETEKLEFKCLNFWRIEIKKGQFKETLFIGPFLWRDMKNKLPICPLLRPKSVYKKASRIRGSVENKNIYFQCFSCFVRYLAFFKPVLHFFTDFLILFKTNNSGLMDF